MKNQSYAYYLSLASVVVSLVAVGFAVVFPSAFDGLSGFDSAMQVGLGASVIAALLQVSFSRMRERKMRRGRIFVIYSSKDRDAAAKLVEHLRSEGYDPWFDVDEIMAGQKWAQAIMEGIAESAAALYLVSANLDASSKFVADELKAAMSMMRSRDESFSPVIPVRLDDSNLPPELQEVHWVDLRDNDGLDQLEQGLARVLGPTSKRAKLVSS